MTIRAPIFRGFDLLPGEIAVDNFAGGGGASEGIERALGRPVDVAINHSPEAIRMHEVNHPGTKHYCEDIFAIDPREVCSGRRVGVAWFSPDCTHFSRAKGTAPRRKEIRALANVVHRWAELPPHLKPRIILLENVQEFLTWGPLDEDGQPIKERAGEDFRAWLARLIDLGYQVDFRPLVAADYGTPSTRKRLFLIARCDRGPLAWPAPSHGEGRPQEWRQAYEIIDFSLPCRSIFGRKKPLAEATMQRIAAGIQRFVVDTDQPFIVPVTHQGGVRVHSIREPLRTVTGANRGELALVNPFLVRHGHYSTKTGAGLRPGCGAGLFRGQQLNLPLATVCGTNDKNLVVPFIAKHYGGVVGHAIDETIGTVTAKDHHSLIEASLRHGYEETDLEADLRQGDIERGRELLDREAEAMLETAFGTKFYGTSTGFSLTEPMPTVLSGGDKGGGHIGQVRAFLMKYYSGGSKNPGKRKRGRSIAQQQSLFEPLHTVTSKARFGLVMVRGEPYQIVDIGLRMLTPAELFRAQGFPDDYIIDPDFNGKPLTATAQTKLAGNSVCPQVSEALVTSALLSR